MTRDRCLTNFYIKFWLKFYTKNWLKEWSICLFCFLFLVMKLLYRSQYLKKVQLVIFTNDKTFKRIMSTIFFFAHIKALVKFHPYIMVDSVWRTIKKTLTTHKFFLPKNKGLISKHLTRKQVFSKITKVILYDSFNYVDNCQIILWPPKKKVPVTRCHDIFLSKKNKD